MHLWPFWAGGLALAAIAVGFYWATGRMLGVSGSLARSLDGPAGPDEDALSDPRAIDALLAATRAEFGDAAPPVDAPDAAPSHRMPPLAWGAHLALLAGLLGGGLLGALSRGALRIRVDPSATLEHLVGRGWRSWAALVFGGVLVGFGTRMAGGCTSGHGLCGTSRLERGSLLATASFFGAAVAVSLLLSRWAS